MMTALTLGLLVVVALLVGRIQKMAQDQRELWRRLNSISLMPGWIRLRDDTGEVNISAGSLGLRGPHGHASPGLNIHTVPGTVYKYPYTFHDGRESQEEAVRGGGFDIEFTNPPLPDYPLPPHIRLEFRNDTLTIRTWNAKLETAEWQTGDGY